MKILTSLYSRLVAEKGISWLETYWKNVYKQNKDEWFEELYDCSCARIEGKHSSVSEYALLWDAWVNFRKEDIIKRHLPTYQNQATQNTYLIPYFDALKTIRIMGCSLSTLEKSMTYSSIDGFKSYLLNQYPNSATIINSITSSPQKKADEFTFVTFNIMRSKYKIDHKQSDHIHKIARTIACLNPDIVFLQEIFWGNNFDKLKELTGMDGVFHVVYNEWGYDYGIGVLWSKRLGAPNTRYVELKFAGFENRGFSIAEFPKFVFISTHWCVKESNNRMLLSNKMLEIASSITNKAIFLGGDFNSDSTKAEIKNLTNSGFKILNDLNNKQGSSDGDLILELNKSQDVYAIVSRGSKFPLESWRTTGSAPFATSDHSPYYVVLKRN